MEMIFATMVVLGCTENLLVCSGLTQENLYYESVESCQKHVQEVIDSTPTYPVILAKCLSVDGGARSGDIKVNWYLDPTRHLQAYVETHQVDPAPIDVASVDDGSDS